MPDEKAEKTTFDCRLCFNEVKKEEIDQKFARIVALIDENKKTLNAKIDVRNENKVIVVDTEEFGIVISFDKPVVMRIVLNNPVENITTANEVFNKFLNYLNTVFSEEAKGVTVMSSLVTRSEIEMPNLAARILGEGRIAKVNELAGESVRPISIGFDFKSEKKDFMLMCITSINSKSSSAVSSSTTYKDITPFNVLDKEIAELEKPSAILKKLNATEM